MDAQGISPEILTENRKRGQAPIAASGPQGASHDWDLTPFSTPGPQGASHDWGLTPFSTPPYLRAQCLV